MEEDQGSFCVPPSQTASREIDRPTSWGECPLCRSTKLRQSFNNKQHHQKYRISSHKVAPVNGFRSRHQDAEIKVNFCKSPGSVYYDPGIRTHRWSHLPRNAMDDALKARRRARAIPPQFDLVKQTSLPMFDGGKRPGEIPESFFQKRTFIRGAPTRKTQRRKRNRKYVLHSRARRNSILLAKNHSYSPRAVHNHDRASDNLFSAIFTTIFCCLPLGVASLFYAFQVRKFRSCGKHEKAQKSSMIGRKLANTGIMLGMTILGFVFVYFVVRWNVPYVPVYYLHPDFTGM